MSDKFTHKFYDENHLPLTTVGEIQMLIKSIHSVKNLKTAVELGCYAGRTSIILASELPSDAQYVAVDNFAIDYSKVRPYVVDELFPQHKNIRLIEESTEKAAYTFQEPIDWLFIDADHQDHSIEHDCRDWLPKVRSGGLIAFHDYYNFDMFPSVSRRVEEKTMGWKIYGSVDSLMIKVKP